MLFLLQDTPIKAKERESRLTAETLTERIYEEYYGDFDLGENWYKNYVAVGVKLKAIKTALARIGHMPTMKPLSEVFRPPDSDRVS